ncbi:MAG: hypothetical protein HON65_12780 [Rhodospirillales bacterium]|jgi:hypothetical protein|nr:hypothetical protein [Rhodospirillales bacterium]
MKFFIPGLALVLMLTFSTIEFVSADDSVPPPQNGEASNVTEFEKDMLNVFFKTLNETQQATDDTVSVGDIVNDVLKTVVNGQTQSQSDDSDDVDDGDADEDDDEGKGKGKSKDKKKKKDKDKKKDKKKSGLPPGLQKQLAKNGTLPPGLQKKLEESGALPPGLQARALPQELEAQLPPLPEGQTRVISDDDVLIIEDITGIILDSIPDIIPPELVPVLSQLPNLVMQ